MSTYMYLRCLDHDPPLEAGEESGQHHYDLRQIFADIRDRDVIVRLYNEGAQFDYFRQHTASFLAAHPKCNIDVINEYEVVMTEKDAE